MNGILQIEPYTIEDGRPETEASCAPIRVPGPPSEPTPEQRMRIIEVSGALDFWNRPEEDVYTLEDGEPV